PGSARHIPVLEGGGTLGRQRRRDGGQWWRPGEGGGPLAVAGRDARGRPALVALVATVLNERGSIDALLESIHAQTRPPDVVVIADGGSRDGTRERLAEWSGRLPLEVVEAPGSSIARGRNLAIEAVQAAIIAVT